MFARPPAQREWVSWLSVVLWSLLIFATIPLARAIERVVVGAWGQQFFLYAVLIVIGAAAVETFRYLRRLGTISGMRVALLGGVALVFGAYTLSLRHNAVEAVHFVEYGVLGLLAFRALTHRMHDSTIYPAAACIAVIVGILDEGIQWATPERVWDILDIWRNFFGTALVLVGIAAGIRPPLITDRPSPASIRLLCRFAAVAVLLLGTSLLNTPPRIGWYTEKVPGLAFLRESSDVMLEYGHLYTDQEIGLFRSRFPPDELRRVDEERGAEVGPILARYPEDAYGEFLARYTPVTDPFAHEARVHLFRRDRYLEISTGYPDDEQHARSYLTIGFREQLILEKYFPNTLRHSGSALTPEQRAELAERQFADETHVSSVSKNLVTELSERDIVLGWLATLALLVAIHRSAGRRSST